jgi:hypothetical protein
MQYGNIKSMPNPNKRGVSGVVPPRRGGEGLELAGEGFEEGLFGGEAGVGTGADEEGLGGMPTRGVMWS